MLSQLKKGEKLRKHARQEHSSEVVDTGVEGVYWSYTKACYRAKHTLPSGKPSSHYTKCINKATAFARTGQKHKRKHDGESGQEDDSDKDTNGDGESTVEDNEESMVEAANDD